MTTHPSHETPPGLRARFVEDEAGISMLLVIGMAVVLLLTAMVGLDITNGAIDRSSRHVTFESSAHLAERGIDLTLARLQQDKTWSTDATHTTALPVGATPAQEEAWAAAELAAAPTVTTAEGEFAIVKPSGRNVVYAAGWMPDRATAARPRTMKVEYLFSTYRPPGAVLTGGPLKIGGNATVAGSLGDVHSNGNIDVVGGSLSVSGTVTAVGTVTGGQPGWSGSQPEKTIPPIAPRDIYEALSDDYAADWYDLCPDGTVKAPSTTPCTGTLLNAATPGEWLGFQHVTTAGKNVWKTSSSTAYDGVFYAYQSGIDVSAKTSSVWKATLIAESAPTSGCSANHGDIQITGHPDIIGFVPGLTLVAGRDLEIAGNPSGGGESYQGLIAAHEQVKITGTPVLAGAIVAGDFCQTTGSPVDGNYISGNMTITYDGGLDTNLTSLIRTTLWLEL